jgi:Cellobiose phosphorylase
MMNNREIYGPSGQKWAQFRPDCAGIDLFSLNLPAPWEYIYQNHDVLLKVDQFGPVYAQANPPGGIQLFRRENGQKFSSWAVWLQSDELEDRKPFTNFFRPLIDGSDPSKEPQDLKITFLPHCASYEYRYQDLLVKTEFFVPLHGTEIVMKLRVKNLRQKAVGLSVCPTFVPYVNPAQLAPWDKYEWYLKSGVGREEKELFWSQLLSSTSDPGERRTAALWTDSEGLCGTEISCEKFVGCGDLSCPQSVTDGNFRMKPEPPASFGEYREDNAIWGYPPVYAAKYGCHLEPGGERVFTQVLCMPQNAADGGLPAVDDVKKPLAYFEAPAYERKKEEARRHFSALCRKNTVRTGQKDWDYFINNWLPLQMEWVASLDRGWPTAMRGTRDCAQDYTAMLSIDDTAGRVRLLEMLSCQRSDGWFPRQFSTEGRTGRHDLRGHVDAGAFVIEFVYEYLSYSGDSGVLDAVLPWLDSDGKNTVLEHLVRAMEYYIDPENLGEHGLCKIGEGDWLDSVNRAGVLGRGESVMVSEQAVMCLQYMTEILENRSGPSATAVVYREKAEGMKKNLLEHAYNQDGFFNGIFTDEGKWIFSDQDPDGEKRPYGPANWFALISGVVSEEKRESVLRVMELLKCEAGYRLYWPPMGKIPIRCVGRAASGDAPAGFAENGNVYNHGAQGFLARALAAVGNGDALFDVLQWLLPYDQSRHPSNVVLSPPYAIVNCWQELPVFRFRSLFSFLTGSVGMAQRAVYEWMFGIRPTLDGLVVDPCIPGWMDSASVEFTYRGKRVKMEIRNPNARSCTPEKVELNGVSVFKTRKDPFHFRTVFVLGSELFQDGENTIRVIL